MRKHTRVSHPLNSLLPTNAQGIRRIPDARLWHFRTDDSNSLVEYVRERLSRQLAASGAPPEAVNEAMHLLDPNALTLGFAWRFATYKKLNLLQHKPKRLLRLLTNPERLVQGVNIWLNTPRRPWEPSGTSGMKVLVKGGIHRSELDGWWAKAYTAEVGWANGDGQEVASDDEKHFWGIQE